MELNFRSTTFKSTVTAAIFVISSIAPSYASYCSWYAYWCTEPLYHYTTAAGRAGITTDMAINPSLPPDMGGRTTDTQHGAGQYFTDIEPGTRTLNQIARTLYGNPFPAQQARITDWVLIDVSDLSIANPAINIYVNNTTEPLDISGRLLDQGTTPQ